MKILIQECLKASLTVDGKEISKINRGEVLFIGFKENDNKEIVDKMLNKLLKLRIFKDSNDKTNLDINAINGEILAISQFTLYASTKEGNRPSFALAMKGEEANKLYEYLKERLNELLKDRVKYGIFGADMKVSLINDGPFTIMLDSEDLK